MLLLLERYCLSFIKNLARKRNAVSCCVRKISLLYMVLVEVFFICGVSVNMRVTVCLSFIPVMKVSAIKYVYMTLLFLWKTAVSLAICNSVRMLLKQLRLS